MNYRHAFHAGNFADVLKHVVLARIVDYLKRKDAPFLILDTHAGRGRYDLTSDEAARTGESAAGIARIVGEAAARNVGEATEGDVGDAAAPPTMQPYLDIVRALQDDQTVLRWYPGSPRVARALLRPKDRLFACELHPADAEALAAEFAGDHQVRCFALDGYQAVRAFLPPRERRGLVLVDPPFEVPDEFDRLAALLRDGLARWETGTFLLWYPIKHARQVDDFLSVAGSICAARPTLSIQLLLSPPDGLRLAGCGLVVVNPPYTLATEMAEILPYLEQTLGLGAPASGHIRWLANAPD